MFPRPAEVYCAELPRQGGEHLVVVVSESKFNKGHSILVVPFTSENIDRSISRGGCALFEPDSYPFLKRRSLVKAESIDAIEVFLLGDVLDLIRQEDKERIKDALAEVFGMNHWPDAIP